MSCNIVIFKSTFLSFAAFAGIVLCLVFNVVAITVNWIRGGGNYFTINFCFCVMVFTLSCNWFLCFIFIVVTTCRSDNLFPRCNIFHTWDSSFICPVVQASIPCYEVRLNNLYISFIRCHWVKRLLLLYYCLIT